MKKTFYISALFLLALPGCSTFDKAGNNLGKGLNKNTEAIGRNLMLGVGQGISDSAFRANLKTLVDSVVNTAGLGLNRNVSVILDTLLSPKWFAFTRQLVEDLTGNQTKANVAALRNELVGAETSERVKLLISNALNEALSERTRARLALMRDELLGDNTSDKLGKIRTDLLGARTNEAIRAIVDSSMMRIAYRMNHDVKDAIGENASFIQKYAGRLLILLGVIAAVIIWLVWRNKQKYLKLVSVLTAQINSIPDQKLYDELTTRIKERAVETGVEPKLRHVLEENGLMGKDNWEVSQSKKRNAAISELKLHQ
jgi:hypothetical protein